MLSKQAGCSSSQEEQRRISSTPHGDSVFGVGWIPFGVSPLFGCGEISGSGSPPPQSGQEKMFVL